MSHSSTKTSSTSNQVLTPNVPNWISQPTQNVMGMFGPLSQQGAPNIGPSGLQTQAWQGAAGLNTGSTTGAAQGVSRDLMGYTPQSVTAGQLGDTDLSRYMNPYLKNVVDATMADYQNAIGTGFNAINAQTPTGAFGGARQGVAQGQFAADNARGLGATLANLYSGAFGNAQDAARFDIGNRLNADQFNSQQGLAGAQFRLGASNQYAGQQLADQANSRANIGMMGDMGAQERQVAQETDPRNAQMTYYANLLRAMGFDPSQYIGATTNTQARGTQSTNGFNVGFKIGPFSFGG